MGLVVIIVNLVGVVFYSILFIVSCLINFFGKCFNIVGFKNRLLDYNLVNFVVVKLVGLFDVVYVGVKFKIILICCFGCI